MAQSSLTWVAMPRPSRKRLLEDAARTVFSGGGYERTTMQDVAVKTGMLKGSIYAHYSSKEDLYYSLLLEEVDGMLQRLKRIVRSGATPTDKLREAIRCHITQHLPSPLQINSDWRGLRKDRLRVIRSKRREYATLWQQIIDDGIASGEFGIDDPWIARVISVSVAEHTLTWLRPNGDRSPDDVADALSNLLLTGLLPRGGDGHVERSASGRPVRVKKRAHLAPTGRQVRRSN
jgi:TetR/AcrR family transcriptional regulator, cholesterol catabolism regulator